MVFTVDVDVSSGNDPNGDIVVFVTPAVPCTKTIRLHLRTAEGSAGAIAEIEAYAN